MNIFESCIVVIMIITPAICFIAWLINFLRADTQSLKPDIITTITIMKEDAFEAMAVLERYNLDHGCKGITCYLIISALWIIFEHLLDDIESYNINKVHYMLVYYYNKTIEPLLKVVSAKLMEDFNNVDKSHADDGYKDGTKTLIQLVMNRIYNIENTFEQFNRTHTVADNSKACDGFIESMCEIYSTKIKEGKL